MSEAEEYFQEIGSNIKGAALSQMFGKPCFKINGKAFLCFFQNNMVFKLNEPEISKALKLNGSVNFDPSQKNRPMKAWIQIPFLHKEHWEYFAEVASNI